MGRILHVNKDPVAFPCYKVVFADGKLSQGYAAGGMAAQKRKLEADGIKISNNKLDLSVYRYES